MSEKKPKLIKNFIQAMFASSIPEIIELVGSGSKYGGELKREHGKRQRIYFKTQKKKKKKKKNFKINIKIRIDNMKELSMVFVFFCIYFSVNIV